EPGLDTVADTFNDDEKTGTKQIHVTPPHVHHWTSTGNTADVAVHLRLNGVDKTSACTVQVLDLTHDPLTPDQDICDEPGCSFPNGVAVEDPLRHQLVRYTTTGGGKFGRYSDANDFQELAATDVANIT